MAVDYQDVVMAFDFDRLTSDGKLYDYGPYGLHATPGAGAAAPTRNLDGSYAFATVPQYFTLPMSWFTVAPTGSHTWLFGFRAVASTNDMQFLSWEANGGNNYGILAFHSTTNTLRLYTLGGVPGTPEITVPCPISKRARHNAIVTVEASPRAVVDGARQTATWTIGAWTPPVYFGAAAPVLGYGGGWTGTSNQSMYYTALIRGSLASSDLSLYSRLISEGIKPWCYR